MEYKGISMNEISMNDQKNFHCYTIGHSNHPIEDFIKILKKFHIQCIIDVRTIPSSNYMVQFNRENFQAWLEREGIEYNYLGDMIGGRYTDPALLDSKGSVDYEKVGQRSIFHTGINQVCQIINAGKPAALMCSEKDPLDCHRFVLVSKVLAKSGISIDHILFDGTIVSNSNLEKKLREMYKSHNDMDNETLYRRRNKEVAFNINGRTDRKKYDVNRQLDSFFS
jgi:uncharacterized protein (DUF488 family)